MLTFAPDSDETVQDVLHLVSAVPTSRGYGTPPSLIDLGSDALAASPAGAATLIDYLGTAYTYAATSAAIYAFGSNTWTSKVSATLNRVRFASFGAYQFACNIASQLLKSTAGSSFTTVTAPKARCIASVNTHLMLANCNDASVSGLSTSFGEQTNRWWVSPLFDGTAAWNPAIATGCYSGLLVATAGAITGLCRMNNDVVAYKDNSLYTGTYVGGTDGWDFRLVSDFVGCATQDAVVNVDNRQYFIGQEDIYVFDGSRPQSIGEGVREWFFSTLYKRYALNIQARHDPLNKLIFWHYPTGSSESLAKVMVLHYPSGRFGAFDLAIKEVARVVGDGEVLIDTANDTARELTMMCIGTDDKAKGLIGTTSPLTATTAWIGGETDVMMCDRVKPRFSDTEPTSGAIVSSTCSYVGKTPTTGATYSLSAGRFDLMTAARYHRIALTLNGPCEVEAMGVRLQPEGDE